MFQGHGVELKDGIIKVCIIIDLLALLVEFSIVVLPIWHPMVYLIHNVNKHMPVRFISILLYIYCSVTTPALSLYKENQPL